MGGITLRTWNANDTPVGEKAQWKFTTIHELHCRKGENGETPTVTALKFIGYVKLVFVLRYILMALQ